MTEHNPPAFPCDRISTSSEGLVSAPGLTMLDHFAGLAMQIMWDAYDKGYCGLNNQDAPNTEIIAKGAYHMADAMLKERAKWIK